MGLVDLGFGHGAQLDAFLSLLISWADRTWTGEKG